MFRRYEIKKAHGEERLYLYMDMSYEIGKFNKPDNKVKLMDQIIDYVNFNNIKFSGKKVVLVVGGLVLGTIFLTTSINTLKPKENTHHTYVDRVFLNSYTKDNELENINAIKFIQTHEVEEIVVKHEELNEKKNDTISNNNTANNKSSNTSNNTNTNKNTVTNNKSTKDNTTNNNKQTPNKETSITTPKNSTTSTPKNNTQSNTNTKSNTTTTNKSTDTISKPVTTTGPIVTLYRSNGTVEQLALEQYLIGVVAAEMPASFNSEALKVQAVIARTYALRLLESGRVLTDTVSTQAYKDNNQLKAMWGSSYNTYYNKIKNAVDATKDVKITYNGKLIEALYFSCSNGLTEDAVNVWGNNYAYLKSVESKWDIGTTAYLKEASFNFNNLTSLLGFNVTSITPISIDSKNNSERVSSITIGSKTYTGVEFRTILGLRSADFDIDITANGITVTTRGYGHGVGLSQYGANAMAEKGYTYSGIIRHYYQGVTITK